jgi:hypothetical protein
VAFALLADEVNRRHLIKTNQSRKVAVFYQILFKEVEFIEVDESITLFAQNVMATMLWYINVLSKNRIYPPLLLTRSRVKKHGGENEQV